MRYKSFISCFWSQTFCSSFLISFFLLSIAKQRMHTMIANIMIEEFPISISMMFYFIGYLLQNTPHGVISFTTG